MEQKRFRKHFPLYLCFLILNLAFIWGNSLVPGDVSGEISGGVFEMVAGLFAVFGDKGQLVLRKLAHFTEFTALGFFLTACGETPPAGSARRRRCSWALPPPVWMRPSRSSPPAGAPAS